MHTGTSKNQKHAQLFISIRMHGISSYVRMCARIIMKINMVIDSYTDSLSFKFYEDPFIGCGEIAETKMSMHFYHF